MFKVGGYAVLLKEKEIKIIEEFEQIGDVVIAYMTDGTSYCVDQLTTVQKTAELEGFVS